MYTLEVLESVSFRMCNEMLELGKQVRKLEPAWCLESEASRSSVNKHDVLPLRQWQRLLRHVSPEKLRTRNKKRNANPHVLTNICTRFHYQETTALFWKCQEVLPFLLMLFQRGPKPARRTSHSQNPTQVFFLMQILITTLVKFLMKHKSLFLI